MMVAHFARARIIYSIKSFCNDSDGVGGVNSQFLISFTLLYSRGLQEHTQTQTQTHTRLYSEVFYSKIEMKNHL